MDELAKWWVFLLPIAEKWWPSGLPPIAWAAWRLWWKGPKLEVAELRHSIRNPKDRVDVEDTLRKPIGQAIYAMAVLAGAYFALVEFLEQRDTALEQIKVSHEQVRISQQQVQASHDLLISNQIAKGFEQLGSDKIEVRLGGIYALEGIMNMPPPDKTSPDYKPSPDYRKPVLEALCAFVREHTIGMIVADKPTTDVQAVLTVIGRRPEELQPVDLSNAVLPGARMEQADLRRVILQGANLRGAWLALSDLRGAHLDGAHLDDAHLDYANLSGGATLFGATMRGADLTEANLSGAGLIADLSGADLRGANLRGANLMSARLIGAHLNGADLSDADLGGGELTLGLLSADLDNQEQLSEACGRPKVLPKGFTLDRPCPPKTPSKLHWGQ